MVTSPTRIINSSAPTRICDNGGWTDTWFARRGRVFNIAVYPRVDVQVRAWPKSKTGPGESTTVHAAGDGLTAALIEATLQHMKPPADLRIEVSIASEMPAGCSTGTSAALTVALIGALDRLTPGRMAPHEVAMAAHRVEREQLGRECGVQDQFAAAYGGVNIINVYDFPRAEVTPLRLPEPVYWELERRLLLVYVGKGHNSSEVHKHVIERLSREGADSSALAALRQAAERSKDAVLAADFDRLGEAMRVNTEAQRQLHPALIGAHHQHVIDIAAAHGAAGWKVNGAGGDGGSVTILAPAHAEATRAIVTQVEARGGFRLIPLRLDRAGVRTWESQALSPPTDAGCDVPTPVAAG